MTDAKRIDLQQRKNVLVAILSDQTILSADVVRELTHELLAAIDQTTCQRVVVSFDQVSRCSTEVINLLLLAKKRLLADGRDIHLCAMSESIRHTYRLLNLDGTVFVIHDTLETACANETV